VRSVLNFAPAVLTVPPGVELRKVDLSTELQILAFHEQRRVSAIALEAAAKAVVPDDVGDVAEAELGSAAPTASGLRV
jgi:redox-sensing transcriptional repressor